MDTKKLCIDIERATKSLTPISVTPVEAEGRIGTIRIVAEGFAKMKTPQRIVETLRCINSFDETILKKYDLTFELLSPVENTEWNQ